MATQILAIISANELALFAKFLVKILDAIILALFHQRPKPVYLTKL